MHKKTMDKRRYNQVTGETRNILPVVFFVAVSFALHLLSPSDTVRFTPGDASIQTAPIGTPIHHEPADIPLTENQVSSAELPVKTLLPLRLHQKSNMPKGPSYETGIQLNQRLDRPPQMTLCKSIEV